jgi:KipI family sensor histidine kinase inhibitor
MPAVHVELMTERHLRLVLGTTIDIGVNRAVHALDAWLAARALPGRIEQWPGYAELVVAFAPGLATAAMRNHVAELVRDWPGPDGSADVAAQAVSLTIDFSPESAPDLADCARHAGLHPDDWCARFVASRFQVALIGFQPGFPYLLGLDPALAMPRRATPRLRVPAGSVAIGGAQTGIYPAASPGGWQLVGRTGAVLFDPLRDPPCLLAPGQAVRFSVGSGP